VPQHVVDALLEHHRQLRGHLGRDRVGVEVHLDLQAGGPHQPLGGATLLIEGRPVAPAGDGSRGGERAARDLDHLDEHRPGPLFPPYLRPTLEASARERYAAVLAD
jgi:hypothetical protein